MDGRWLPLPPRTCVHLLASRKLHSKNKNQNKLIACGHYVALSCDVWVSSVDGAVPSKMRLGEGKQTRREVTMGSRLARERLRRPREPLHGDRKGVEEMRPIASPRLFSPLLAEQSIVLWVAVKAPCFAV